MTITVSITQIAPSKLYLFRWLCKLANAKIHVCAKRKRKEVVAA